MSSSVTRFAGALIGSTLVLSVSACLSATTRSVRETIEETGQPAARAANGSGNSSGVPGDLEPAPASSPERPAARSVADRLREAQATVEQFFGQPFPRPYGVHVLPDRAAFSEFLKNRWGMPETQCWMVAAGTASVMVTIDPAAWKTEACEHDPSDDRHVQQLLTHELVHVFHGQHNPRPEFDGLDDIGWFVEGLAVYASGQFDAARRNDAREAIEKGQAPARLEDAWSGRYRYAVAGSMAAYVDHRLGRAKVLELLGATKEDELLAALGMSEAGFLDAWSRWCQ